MKKIYIIMIVMALLAATYLPELIPSVKATSADHAVLAEIGSPQGNTMLPERTAVSPSPLVAVAIGLFTLLFGILTFLPILWPSPNRLK